MPIPRGSTRWSPSASPPSAASPPSSWWRLPPATRPASSATWSASRRPSARARRPSPCPRGLPIWASAAPQDAAWPGQGSTSPTAPPSATRRPGRRGTQADHDGVLGGMTVFFRRIRKEIEALRAEVQELRDKLDEREQELEPCIGFVFEQSSEYEDELDMVRRGGSR